MRTGPARPACAWPRAPGLRPAPRARPRAPGLRPSPAPAASELFTVLEAALDVVARRRCFDTP
ncbi:hypothetical protein ROS62_24275 [Streptomyces sp. DSM 41972]|uniref:Uncharacterized protein n=1 Tax=Streptomyces althioticus subsp. attaecolombicae TaxID=3075534 RepID=A0ABU3I4D3_9ACTN|nr:hypothetical protein [Streptomyces sp. DSM 41972]